MDLVMYNTIFLAKWYVGLMWSIAFRVIKNIGEQNDSLYPYEARKETQHIVAVLS